MAGKSAAGVVQETGILDCRRTDDHVTDAVVETAFDRVQVADAAAELHRNVVADGLHDLLDRPLVLRLAGKGAVEIDHMQAARSLRQPVARLLSGRTGEDGYLVHETLFEADALSLFQVNRGNDQHVGGEGRSEKLKRSE